MDSLNVPFIILSNNVELPSLTVVPLLSLNMQQKSDVFCAAINAGYTSIDLSNIGTGIWSLTGGILDDFELLNIKRENIFLTIKMMADENLNQIKKKISTLTNIFRTDYVNLLMVGIADNETKHRQGKKIFNNNNTVSKSLMDDDHLEQGTATATTATALINPMDTLLDAWTIAEHLYKEGKVKALGVSRIDIELVKQLCERANIGPHCWQIDLAPLMANFEDVLALKRLHKVVPIVRANAMGASSKFGTQHHRGFYHTLLREMATKYGKSATQVLCRWLYQHGMAVVCSCSTSTRIGQQTNIFDYRISAEDMLRLNGLYSINSVHRPCQ